MIKAWIFDKDDFFTRAQSPSIYTEGAYAAFAHVMTLAGRQSEIPVYPEYKELSEGLYYANQCVQSGVAAKFGIDALEFFHAHHDKVDKTKIECDTASTEELNRLTVPALILTDGSMPWASHWKGEMGHSLPIIARDTIHERTGEFVRKATSNLPFQLAHAALEDMHGAPLAPEEIGLGDDSSSVLQAARNYGFKTVRGHFGHPGRMTAPDFKPAFDAEIEHVGTFLSSLRLGTLQL